MTDAAEQRDAVIAQLRSNPAVKRVEVIGGQTLILGDSLEVMPVLGRFDAVVTDPPYGMAFQSNRRTIKHRAIANDTTLDLLRWACEIDVAHSRYVWMRWDNLKDIPMPRSLITWVKNNHSMGDLEHEHGRKTEVCAFYRGPDHRWPSQRPVDVVSCPRTGNGHHPTEKPIQLIREVVEWTIGRVADPFMGSGTTLVACQKMGRQGTGIEIDPEYWTVACERVHKAWQQADLFIQSPTAPEPQQERLFDV